MDVRPTWTDCDEAGDYVVPNVLSPRDLVFRPDNRDETVPHTNALQSCRAHTYMPTFYIIYSRCVPYFSKHVSYVWLNVRSPWSLIAANTVK